MRRLVSILTLCTAGFFLYAIGPSRDSSSTPMWVLDSFANGGILPSDFSKPVLTLEEKSMSFGGNNGCNRIGGKMMKKGNNLQFSEIRSTRMACIRYMDISFQFDKALRATYYTVSKDSQMIFQDSTKKPILYFSRKTK